MANSASYIPPEGLAFRLIGHISKKALVSRSSPDPHVTHKSVDKCSSGQLFTLLDDASRHRKGYYAIKSKATGNFFYSRHISGKCQVWHRNGDPNYDDEWFKLDPGKGAFMTMFRLVNKDTVILNGTVKQSEPELRNESKDRPNRAEQYFIFDFGEMEFLNIKYDLDDSKGRYSHGFPIKEGTRYKSGIPMVSEGKVSMLDISQIDKAWKFGCTMDPFAKDWKAILPAVKIPPQETVRVTTTIMRGRLEVPFTVTLRSKANGFEVRTYGIWSGISTWDLRRTVVTRHGLESRQIAV